MTVSIALRWAASALAQNRINSNGAPTTFVVVISTNNTGLIGMSRTSSTDYQGLDESGTINTRLFSNTP